MTANEREPILALLVRVRRSFGWIGLVEPEYRDYGYHRARYSILGSRRSQAAFERRMRASKRQRSMVKTGSDTGHSSSESRWTE